VAVMRCNTDIREKIEAARLKYFEIAKEYGCNDNSFSRKLREELSAADKQKIFAIIEKLKKERF